MCSVLTSEEKVQFIEVIFFAQKKVKYTHIKFGPNHAKLVD